MRRKDEVLETGTMTSVERDEWLGGRWYKIVKEAPVGSHCAATSRNAPSEGSPPLLLLTYKQKIGSRCLLFEGMVLCRLKLIKNVLARNSSEPRQGRSSVLHPSHQAQIEPIRQL